MAKNDMGGWARGAVLAASLAWGVWIAPAAAEPTAEPFYSDGPGCPTAVRTALDLCAVAADPERADRQEALEEGLDHAERAVASHPGDARAHFALFCHLGRRAQAAGVGTEALSVVGRMKEAVARALELQPTYVDALVGQGAMLLELPWFLGGDEDLGEELLRRALALDRGFEPALTRLAAHLEDEGRLDEMPVRFALHRTTPEG